MAMTQPLSGAQNSIDKSDEEAFSQAPLPQMGLSASGRQWRLRAFEERVAIAIAQNCELDLIIARALAARGVTIETAPDYLNPSLRAALPDPFVLTDMKNAAEHLAAAVAAGRTIGVFGDYDVDGTTASAILKLYFRELGFDLPVYLPDRIAEGYGPSITAFRALKEQGADIIVTVDCGAAAHEPIEAAVAEGLEVIVLDHHLMSGPPPQGAIAVVNPNRPDDISGLGNLSAAGVAFMMIVALNRALRENGWFNDRKEPSLLPFLDLAALGLVCDVMDMTGLTRVLVAQGLKVLGQGGNLGLQALGARAGVKGTPSAYDLGFLLGPRINAAGRIGHARLAFNLMTEQSAEQRNRLAEELHVMNAARQEIERDVLEAALAQVERENKAEQPIIIVAGEGWHPGVIGVVAGRIKEKYDRPVFVIAIDENGVGKGSGRSITGVDLGAAVGQARKEGLLIAGGGHAMAAGLTVSMDQLSAFEAYLASRLRTDVDKARQNRTLWVDSVIGAQAVGKPLADRVAMVGPFGPGNAEPVFVLRDMRVKGLKVVGAGHLSCTLASPTGEIVRAIAFRAEGEPLGEILTSGEVVHLSGKVRVDDWRGGDSGQFHIGDAAYAAA